MSQKIIVDLPHKLGAEEARRRIARGVGGIGEFVPGGAQAESHWTGDRLDLRVTAMGQGVAAAIHVEEAVVRIEMDLPGALAFFAKPVEAFLRRKGTELLEDRRPA